MRAKSDILIAGTHLQGGCECAGVLENAGFETTLAATGESAWRLFREAPPDVILLHHNLPGVSAGEFCERTRGAIPGIRVPLLLLADTAAPTNEKLRCLEAGADGLLVEPVEPEILVATIHALLRTRDAGVLERKLAETHRVQSVGALAGGVGHDFNNLLTGILGGAALARDMLPADHSAAAVLDEVVGCAERAAMLTSQLLAYAGMVRYAFTPVHISGAVRGIEDLLRGSVPHAEDLEFRLDPAIPAIRADLRRVRELTTTLVRNAGEATGGARGRITVSTGSMEVTARSAGEEWAGEPPAPGNYVFLEVRDEGSGIDESIRNRIFDPFFTTRFVGRGLGLAAALGIVRAHRGAIRVESSPGQGSCFRVLFPLADPPSGGPGTATGFAPGGKPPC